MFEIRTGTYEDVTAVRSLMETVYNNLPNKDLYCIADDTTDRIRQCIDYKGFVLIAETSNGEMAGFLVVRYPESDANLGNYINSIPDNSISVVHMETAAVLPKYRGNNLEMRLISKAETMLRYGIRYMLCTVHKDNLPCLKTLEKCGYSVAAASCSYHGDLPRCIMLKERKV